MPDEAVTTPTPAPNPGPTPTGYQRTLGGGFKWQPPDADHLSRLLPQYDIELLCGRGGMGAVYRGKQRALDRPVAIKILPPEVDDEDTSYTQRFKNEAKIMGRMSHPAIVPVYDFGETSEGQLFFVMEFIDGTDVHQMLLQQGKLPPEHALAITAHVCDALKYAHEHGVIHRDIKPSNVLINMEGQVKVADFGLAKMGGHSLGTDLTKSGIAMGTPDYVAPEALATGIEVDGRADLYAVGVMLYQMLTGRVPRGSFEEPSKLVGTDPRFDAIVFKAMKYDREERFQTAGEFRRALDVILTTPMMKEGGKSSAAIPRTAVVSQKPVAKVPQQKQAAAAPNQKVEIRSPKSKAPLFIGIGVAAGLAVGAFMMFGSDKPSQDGPLSPQSGTSQPPIPETALVTTRTTSPSAPNKIREEPKPAPVIVSSAPKPEAPKPAPETQEIPKPAATTPAPIVVARQNTPKPALMAGPKPPAVPASNAPVSPSADGPKPASTLPPEILTLDEQFKKLTAERVSAPFEADVAKLNKSYLGGLDREMAKEKAAGQLDGVLALESEKKRVADKQPIPTAEDDATSATTLPVLKGLRQIYRDAYAKLEATRDRNLKTLTDPLTARLKNIESDLTRKDRIADAKTVREYREGLGSRSGGLQPPSSLQPPPPSPIGSAPPAPTPAVGNTPLLGSAIKGGYTNSLGMKFVKVTGTKVLFCIHETRKGDYAAYAAEVPGLDDTWKDAKTEGVPISFADDHPVVDVNWDEAQAFCEWLSKKEGRTYRLPTDLEWSFAVGIGRDERKGVTPRMLDGKILDAFPWGNKWPPSEGSGNYADVAAKEKLPTTIPVVIEGYNDGFVTTAPVMSFAPNKLGLYDLGGNVWEWCDDWNDEQKLTKAVRGGSWSWGEKGDLLSSNRRNSAPGNRAFSTGFRVVLEEK